RRRGLGGTSPGRRAASRKGLPLPRPSTRRAARVSDAGRRWGRRPPPAPARATSGSARDRPPWGPPARECMPAGGPPPPPRALPARPAPRRPGLRRPDPGPPTPVPERRRPLPVGVREMAAFPRARAATDQPLPLGLARHGFARAHEQELEPSTRRPPPAHARRD